MPRPPAPDFPVLEDFAFEQDEATTPFSRRAPRHAPLDGDDFYDEVFDQNPPLMEQTPFDAPRPAATRPLRGDKEPGTRATRPRTTTTRKTATTKTTKPKSRKRTTRGVVPLSGKTTPRALPYEIAGVLLLTTGAVLLFNSLRASADGLLSQLGVSSLRFLFGLGAPVFAGAVCLLGLILIAYRHRTNFRAFGRGIGAAFLVFLTAVHLGTPRGLEFTSEILTTHGGITGGIFAFLLRRALGEVGAVLALIALAIVALLLFTETTLSDCATALGRGTQGLRDKLNFGSWHRHVGDKYRAAFERDEEEYAAELEEERLQRWSRPRLKRNAQSEDTPGLAPARITPFEPIEELLKNAANALPEFHPHRAEASPDAGEQRPEPENDVDVPAPVPQPPAPDFQPLEEESLNPIEALEAQAQASAGSGGEKPKLPASLALRKRFGDGPPMPEYFDEALAALDPPIPVELGNMDEDTTRGVQHVEDTLKAFRIDARVTDVKRGPVITRYEVQPAPGVRVATIANLDRDLARSLSAYAVRIEAPVPGRNVVGIEVPNKKVHLVRMRDVLEIPEFLSAQSKLAFVLGKDIAGQPKWADLTKMPHMLIAGATNSGKSVCLNSIIASILLRASPEEVKFSLIDPKRVELTLFRDIPHLYHPVVVEPKDAVRALRGAIAEMDRRYKLFATRGVRNVASFNSKLQEGEEPLPYLVIVIDELADLMMTAAAEFEKLICRIAQLARATGIHLIVATQRPSVNVITGVIKANIPARVAFAVASQVDSRTILDSVGAERLIGSGDMLFDANTGGKSVRIQGAYLSEEEVNRVVEVVKARYADRRSEFEYGLDLATVDTGDSKVGGDDDDDVVTEKRDDLYDEIKAFISRYDEMSASLIQRRFEIGYPRAGRIVDQLERDGVLGPADGPKPRKVLSGGRNE